MEWLGPNGILHKAFWMGNGEDEWQGTNQLDQSFKSFQLIKSISLKPFMNATDQRCKRNKKSIRWDDAYMEMELSLLWLGYYENILTEHDIGTLALDCNWYKTIRLRWQSGYGDQDIQQATGTRRRIGGMGVMVMLRLLSVAKSASCENHPPHWIRHRSLHARDNAASPHIFPARTNAKPSSTQKLSAS